LAAFVTNIDFNDPANFDLTYPFQVTGMFFQQKKPTSKAAISNALRAFDSATWIVSLFSLLLVTLTLYFMSKSMNHEVNIKGNKKIKVPKKTH